MASTSETSATSNIIKSDRVGRARYSASFKAEVLAAYARSGMSGPAFAQQCGVKYPTFAAWVSKGRGQAKATPSGNASQRFVLAEFSGPASDAVLKVEFPGGAIAHVTSTSQAGLLASLLKSLT